MNAIANNIKQRLSLRQPLQEALDIIVTLVDNLTLKEIPLTPEEAKIFLNKELSIVNGLIPTCTSFQREFPSVALSIATGVGKTRLMGACISYLYLDKGIKNFFVLAPNITLYNKLIQDFGNPNYEKYVFKGISELVHNRPVIITGDNYNQQGFLFKEGEIRINIFNIAKFNSDNKGLKKDGLSLPPKIKRLSEYLGQSYWDYLSSIPDLVVLMDEAHRYHADASKNAINELKPILGIELTATPFDEKGQIFKNIVYEYSLAKALLDGTFVKNPAIATRKNFKAGDLSESEIELIKLEDAVSIHEDTKTELEIYAKNHNVKLVKPFILVVCRDINHAKQIYALINSDLFYDGKYRGKSLQIDSSTKKEEEIEQQFLSLESPHNHVEIVIHVNMLKEGWDVTNLYTIVPLRAANASVLIEQTIGRGLRLPFGGTRTGVDKIDKLTVVAHENFEAVILAAKNPNSILKRLSFIEIDAEDLSLSRTVITAKPVYELIILEEQEHINQIKNKELQQKSQNLLDAKKAIHYVLEESNSLLEISSFSDLNKEHVKQQILEQIESKLGQDQRNVFSSVIVEAAETNYDDIVQSYRENIIEIPRMDLVQGNASAVFSAFDLDTSDFNYHAFEQEILRIGLTDNSVETLTAKVSGTYESPLNLVIAELINYSEIDYDDNAELLHHLAGQAIDAISYKLKGSNVAQAVFQFKAAIAEKIYLQMKRHFTVTASEYIDPRVLPFTKIEQWNFSALVISGYKSYKDIVLPISSIPKFVFRDFRKSCHLEYKFDSKAELDLAYVLENDLLVIKWLRPAPNQFRIYWDNNARRYEPDFVVETPNSIYMIEPKAASEMLSFDVQSKKQSAIKYCESATKFNLANGGKPWYYLLVPHDEISRSISLSYLIAKFAS
jgi:type III restriction enzyme